jgi:hypothetical protein
MEKNDDKSVLLECLGESPEIRIMDFLIENQIFDYSKKQIIEGTGLARATFFAHWENIEKFRVVKVSRKFGKAKLFQLDKENPIVIQLLKLEWELIELTSPKKTAIEAKNPDFKTENRIKLVHKKDSF